MYVAGIGHAVLELLSFKAESGNHQRGISLLQKFSDMFGNMRLVPLKMTSHLTSHNFQILNNKTNDLILNLTPENVTQHSRIVTTTRKGSSRPTKMSKIIGRQIH